ncbi:MAG: hypothetical protein B7X58_04410 [Marinobacter sp. 34-60-7]|nr:MAG: hypothetical protein B7X58_04410 [Marinobacter sp. 34-60-7]
MSQTPRKSRSGDASEQGPGQHIGAILTGIRVPEMPYPASRSDSDPTPDWRPLLFSCWTEQRDERVTDVLRSVDIEWTVRQVNAAYLADRIMDVYLKTSGLHATLVSRVARLRFWLAWQLEANGAEALSPTVLSWLDALMEWRGWSDTGGRSSRALLEQLESLVIAVSGSFDMGLATPFESYCEDWVADAGKREDQVSRLRDRLLETEQGAARQRLADQLARALIGRALTGRDLPVAIANFLKDAWYRVLKQSIWAQGVDSELYRHANKLLEWLVWIGDPALSDKDRNRLYHVGEQMGDRMADVWVRAFDQPLPEARMQSLQAEFVARIRGDAIDLSPALPPGDRFVCDVSWLDLADAAPPSVVDQQHHWFVEGEGKTEQRRYFFALLDATQEVLWTNGAGVKLGLEPWRSVQQKQEAGELRPLPDPTPFGKVLSDTVDILARVCQKQGQERERAAEDARRRAEALRQERAAAEQQKREVEAEKAAESARQQAEQERQRAEDEKAEQARLQAEREAIALKQVESIPLGGWIQRKSVAEGAEAQRLKLAVKITASRKFVFVDRLGLNRTEFLADELVSEVAAGRIRVLGSAAEFDDTLSRVVGRIRVGRQ